MTVIPVIGSASEPDERSGSTRVDVVCRQVETMIATRALPPGGKLNELALATDLGVSRGLLREAVRLLEKSGLVRIEPNRGAFVRELDIKGVLDLFDVRGGLARIAGQLAAQRSTAEQHAQLKQLYEQMERDKDREAFDSYLELNTSFHVLIFEFAGNRRLISFEEMIAAETHLFQRQNLLRISQLQTSHIEHGRIVDAVIRKDPAKAASAFERHIRNGRQRFMQMISQS